MSDTAADAAPELIDRLRLIEAQPLDMRAQAFAALHDGLARRLESAPNGPSALRP